MIAHDLVDQSEHQHQIPNRDSILLDVWVLGSVVRAGSGFRVFVCVCVRMYVRVSFRTVVLHRYGFRLVSATMQNIGYWTVCSAINI